ncbi:MAG: radical SAM protein [Gammaproteobacteria bacterium]|nr:radical SAM protein [Gammaproteobacteria bacterium]
MPSYYLAPGFFIALTPNCQISLPQLAPQIRRSRPERLAVIDALCNGYTGDLDGLAESVASQAGSDPARLKAYIEALSAAGAITTAQPQPVMAAEAPAGPVSLPEAELLIPPPVLLLPHAGRYHWYNHEGEKLLGLTLAEAQAAAMFCKPTTAAAVRQRCAQAQRGSSLSATHLPTPDDFDRLFERLVLAGVFEAGDLVTRSQARVDGPKPVTKDPKAIVQASVDARVAEHDRSNAQRGLPAVIPVNTFHGAAPAALGLLVAYAMEYDGGVLKDRFDFVPLFLADKQRLLERASSPGIFLFSNYLWTVDENLALSAAIKAVSPQSITIHGGPSTPKYEQDAQEFFAKHQHVDIAVRGEGEHTFAEVLKALDPECLHDLSRLEHVQGISYRSADGVRRTESRDRIADLDTIPSPYLMGLFDDFGASRAGAILETNRGCPFGCTFCDWGSATLSRVRRFDLDRVFRELEWCAQNQIATASFADANFGMLERDVDIARKVADLKRATGYPRTVATNYAKNNVKHLRKIIEIFADVEILTEGVVSLQSMDETTLRIIDRSNIKLEKYNDLTTEFRQANLPLAADIMMGLPGSTPASFFKDLQECTDRDVRVRANPTLLLTNSPMNDPAYRKEHGIVAKPGEILMQTASYTRAEWEDMNQLRIAFNLFDNWGVLRYVGRFVRSAAGIGEVDFYNRLRTAAQGEPTAFPIVTATLDTLEQYMAPPGSWGLFMAEVRQFLLQHLGLAEDSALRTVLAVQLAHLPSPERKFPHRLDLEHDYAAWQQELLQVREAGHRSDWEKHLRPLLEFPPAALVINDPNEVCRIDLGKPMGAIAYAMRSWEMDSVVARPSLGLAS